MGVMGPVKEEQEKSRWEKFKDVLLRHDSSKPKEEIANWNYVPLERTRKGWHGEMDNYKVNIQIKREELAQQTYKIVVNDSIELQKEGSKGAILQREMVFDSDCNLIKATVKLFHNNRTYNLLERDIKKETERMDKGEWLKGSQAWRYKDQKVNKKDEPYIDSKKEVQTETYGTADEPGITCRVWETQREFGDRKTLISIDLDVEDFSGKKILNPLVSWGTNINIIELENTANSFVRQHAVVRVIDKEIFKKLRMP